MSNSDLVEIITTSQGARTAYGWSSGDQPGHPAFAHAVPENIAKVIMEAAKRHFPRLGKAAEIRALGPCVHIVGRYRVAGSDEEYFIRVSSFSGHAELEQRLVRHLQEDGVSVNPLLVAGEKVEFEGRAYRLDVRPFLRGEHECPTDEQLGSLAKVVSKCHSSLRKFDRAGEVREIARQRYQGLERTACELRTFVKEGRWNEIVPHAGWAIRNAGFLENLAEEFRCDFDEREGAQSQHGQIHRANVLFPDAGGEPVLIDFEEAVHVFAPLDWDLAHLVQRFCLFDDPDKEGARRRIAVIESQYGRIGESVFEMMREVAWFSIVILFGAWRERQLVAPIEEYDKFVKLECQARFYLS